ncbi:MAG: HEAT repeat domain-containing protein [Candidatus Aminicenantes bacterium]|nr:HEAT repeat domain-containing protein [Candidatus Aminicenantes bacterium]
MTGAKAEIARLVTDLESLVSGEEACARLICLGQEAVEPLLRFLLEGKPSGVFQPRMWAVQALAGLGAREALIEYLDRDRPIADPQVRLGEEAVQSEAARALAAWPTEDVYRFLIEQSGRRLLIGLIEALAEFRRPESVPVLERALEDDYYRPAAEKALEKMGSGIRESLVSAAVSPRPDAANEAPSSLRRRRAVLALLGKMGSEPSSWPALSGLLEDGDEEVFVAAAKMGAAFAGPAERAAMVERLLKLLTEAPWYLREDIVGLLTVLKAEAEPAIDEEIGRRTAQPESLRAVDKRLWALQKVKRKMSDLG